MSTQVYTDPDEPGAPQPGDLVVPVSSLVLAGYPGAPVALLLETTAAFLHWHIARVNARSTWVHGVRRPTPEEAAAYQLYREAP